MEQALVIRNPKSTAARKWPEIARLLRDRGIGFDAPQLSGPEETADLSEDTARAGRKLILVGGDGTIHCALQGIARVSRTEASAPIGIIPTGGGHDFWDGVHHAPWQKQATRGGGVAGVRPDRR